MGFSLSHWS
jgi:large subunit ribosomal protein LP1